MIVRFKSNIVNGNLIVRMKKLKKKVWQLTTKKKMPTDSEKKLITLAFCDIVDDFRQKFIPKEPDRKYNYVIDIFSKWHRNFFYLCERFKSEHPDRIADEFESPFVRLEYLDKDSFTFSYLRHTGSWHIVDQRISSNECKDLILSNPNFQPLPIA